MNIGTSVVVGAVVVVVVVVGKGMCCSSTGSDTEIRKGSSSNSSRSERSLPLFLKGVVDAKSWRRLGSACLGSAMCSDGDLCPRVEFADCVLLVQSHLIGASDGLPVIVVVAAAVVATAGVLVAVVPDSGVRRSRP